MTTFTFIELTDADGSSRAVALRGDSLSNTRHLSAFITARRLQVTGIWQYDAATLQEAMDWVGQFTYLGRRF